MISSEISLSKDIELNESSVRKYQLTEYKFRLTGVPPEKAIKSIQVDPNHSISEIKKVIKREFKLNPILDVFH